MKWIFSFLLLVSSSAFAESRSVQAMLAYGFEYRPARDASGNFADRILPNYALGVGYQNYLFILEKATFKETTGNVTLNVKQIFENTMLWAQWRAEKRLYFIPFIGAGAGAYQEKVETQFMGATTANSTAQKFLGGASFGLSLDVPVLWFSIEARVLFGDELDPQPTLGGLARIGVYF